MEEQIICFGCAHIVEFVTFDNDNRAIIKKYMCSENKLSDYFETRNCEHFARKHGGKNKEEEEATCWLFTEEEWKAIRNGTYVGKTPMPWDNPAPSSPIG